MISGWGSGLPADQASSFVKTTADRDWELLKSDKRPARWGGVFGGLEPLSLPTKVRPIKRADQVPSRPFKLNRENTPYNPTGIKGIIRG